ncbi:octopressin receptor-like [Saccostrea cucullata]|uniref:octopressin receptor-like n=1 Tax=Saccostrea cuccullata TaxID=36930 RepID=UPI002ED1A20E
MGVETLKDWNEEESQKYTLSTCILSFYLVIGLVGNTLVIILYKTRMNSKNDDRYFIPAIAIIDLIGCVFSTTLSLLNNEQPVMFPGSFSCKLIQFGTCSSIIASLFMLLVISVQRFQKICRPFGFQMNLNHKRLATTIAVILACCFSIPMLLLYQNIEVTHETKNITGHICGSAPGTEKLGDFTRAILITVEVGAVFSMTVLYILVGRKLIEQFKVSRKLHDINSISGTSNSGSNERTTIRTVPSIDAELTDNFSNVENDKKELFQQDMRNGKRRSTINRSKKKPVSNGRRYSIMFMVISLVAIVCYIPPWTFVILEAKDSDFWRSLTFDEVQVFLIIRNLYIVNHIANPFIYGFFDPKFRREVKNLLCGCKIR